MPINMLKDKLSFLKPSFISTFVIIGILFYSQMNIKPWKNAEKQNSLIDWDVTSYYAYLPAYFVHGDLTLSFTDNDSINYSAKHQFWPEKAPNGGKVIKTTMGLSFLYAPFFMMGHLYASSTSQYAANGFSKPYEFFLGLSSIFYLMIGLYYLRKVLLKFFNEAITSVTIVSLVMGTNLYYYCTTEPCMSHAYNFSLISVFMYFVIKWFDAQKLKYAIALGITGGLIVLIRPVNLLVFIFPLLYHSFNIAKTARIFAQFWRHILVIAMLVFMTVCPQLIYWKYITGNWIFNSYVGEQFYFNNPHILEFLFSYRSGWMVYSPIMIFSLTGFLFLYKTKKNFFYALLIPLGINIYVLSCWWCWWYGGSYGMRSIIDFYPFLSIPFAASIAWMYKRNHVIKFLSGSLIVCLISLNLFQTLQRRHSIIHWDSMTKEAFWANFGKNSMTASDWETFNSQLQKPDYKKAKMGIDEYEFQPF